MLGCHENALFSVTDVVMALHKYLPCSVYIKIKVCLDLCYCISG